MHMDHEDDSPWMRITFRRAAVLRELAEGRSESQAAEALGVEVTTVRSHVEELKVIAGCDSVREMGPWWRANRRHWAEYVLAVGGVNAPDAGETGT